MEFMKITDRSLKISLGAKEAKEYNITEEMVGEPSKIKLAFADLLERAKAELGMKLPKGQLLAEVFSSRDGGYEIFVSYTDKGDDASPKSAHERTALQKRSSIKICEDVEQERISGTSQSGAFLLENADTLFYLVSLLKNDGKHEYEAYFSKRSQKYYLIIKSFKRQEIFFAPFFEVAELLRRSEIKYIQSYCEKITL